MSYIACMVCLQKLKSGYFKIKSLINLSLSKPPYFFVLQGTALEVQNLLVTGKRKEALECAQEGQLWGPALVLAAQLGDKVKSSYKSLFRAVCLLNNLKVTILCSFMLKL